MIDLKQKYDIKLCQERIREKQYNLGYTNKDMTEKTGFKKNVYNNLIREKNGNKFIKGEQLEIIAKALSCSAEYLIGESDIPNLNDLGERVWSDKEIIYQHDRLLDEMGDFFIHNLDILKIIYLVTRDPQSPVCRGFINVVTAYSKATIQQYDPNILESIPIGKNISERNIVKANDNSSDNNEINVKINNIPVSNNTTKS